MNILNWTEKFSKDLRLKFNSKETHLVENGIDINLIQKLAGHSNVKTTLLYTQISHNLISNIQSPLSNIKI